MFEFLRGLAAWRGRADRAKKTTLARKYAGTRPRSVQLNVECLEDRLTPAFTNWSGGDQLMLELVNRARANPTAEATRYGIDLNQDLPAGTISAAAKAPLAPQQALINSSMGYSLDMYTRNFFSHVSPEGLQPWQRAANQGYPSTYVGENIAWTTYNPLVNVNEDAVLQLAQNFFLSAGHRQNMLNGQFNEAGIGFKFSPTPYQSARDAGLNVSIVTEDFGRETGKVYLTGVAYSDAVVQNQFYDIGEGLGGITITATNASGQSFSTITATAGGYSLLLAAGTYTVKASGGSLTQPIVLTGVKIGTVNVKRDFVPNQTGGNHAPKLTAIADQTISSGESLFVGLNATDADNDKLTIQVAVQGYNPLYDLEQKLLLYQYNGSYNYNQKGWGEKWLRSAADNTWYFILANGKLYHWGGAGLKTSTLISTLDLSVFQNPQLLNTAQPGDTPDVATNLSDNLLTVTPAASYTGTFRVVVTVSDGKATTTRSFLVTVAN